VVLEVSVEVYSAAILTRTSSAAIRVDRSDEIEVVARKTRLAKSPYHRPPSAFVAVDTSHDNDSVGTREIASLDDTDGASIN
jgi:hypothetical protein